MSRGGGGGRLAMILGKEVWLEFPDRPIHILPISKSVPIHILFFQIPIHILFGKRYPIDIHLMWKWYSFIYSEAWNGGIPHSSRTSIYTFIMEVRKFNTPPLPPPPPPPSIPRVLGCGLRSHFGELKIPIYRNYNRKSWICTIGVVIMTAPFNLFVIEFPPTSLADMIIILSPNIM